MATQTKIIIAGCGPGSPDLIPPAVAQAADRADVLAGTPHLLSLFPDSKAEHIVFESKIEPMLAALDGKRALNIVVLVTGDPGICSLAKPVIKHFGRAACTVIPGISSIQAAFARIGTDWLDARVINAHDLPPSLNPAAVAASPKIAVLCGSNKGLPWLQELAGLVPDHGIFLCENLSLPDERVNEVTPETLGRACPALKTVCLLIRKDLI